MGHPLLRLQRAAGNQAVQRLLQRQGGDSNFDEEMQRAVRQERQRGFQHESVPAFDYERERPGDYPAAPSMETVSKAKSINIDDLLTE